LHPISQRLSPHPLGVGQNLQDHPAVLSAFAIKESANVICATDEIYNAKGNVSIPTILNWLIMGKGAMTSTGCDRGAFVKTTPEKAQPDVQLRYVAGKG